MSDYWRVGPLTGKVPILVEGLILFGLVQKAIEQNIDLLWLDLGSRMIQCCLILLPTIYSLHPSTAPL